MKTTELDSYYHHLDEMSVGDLLQGMNKEDKTVPLAIEDAIPQIEALVEAVLARKGRIFYMGAGTSGRLGVLDASEIFPTYGVEGKFIGIIAGGDKALRSAVEGAEDDWDQGWKDLCAYSPDSSDTLIGISASGSAPYVVGAVRSARRHGLLTGCICCNQESELLSSVEYPVSVVTGPEFVTGSTRMKAGTCTKLVLNMISTSVMILSGHVKGSKMVDMELSNQKLLDRGTRMIMEETQIDDYALARDLLIRYGHVRAAVDAYLKKKQ